MYRSESCTIKKAEHWRIDAFELWCWRRLLRVPWTARSSNQSILEEINPEYSLEGLMLKLQYSGHLMQSADSLQKTLEEKRVTEDEMVGWPHQLNRHESEQTPGDGEGQGSLAWCSPQGCKESDTTYQLSNNKILDSKTFTIRIFKVLFHYLSASTVGIERSDDILIPDLLYNFFSSNFLGSFFQYWSGLWKASLFIVLVLDIQ